MIKKYNRGFTLIELLVVIAIIGILSGIVITALSGARDKAAEARIKADLAGFRTAAELSYNNYGNSYDNTKGGLGICDTTNDSTNTYLESLAEDEVVCAPGYQDYAVSAKINETERWCVDSDGFAGLSAHNSGTDTSCK